MKLRFFEQLDVGQRFLIAGIGGGFDIVHGLPFYTIKAGGYLGMFSLTKEMREGIAYEALTTYLNQNNSQPSIVNNSIASALSGAFGNPHCTEYSRRSPLY